MAVDQQRQDAIFAKTDGHCHICRKKLVRKNRGVLNARGAWEGDHSVPQATGGTHHMNNLLPACISCNRSKQHFSTKSARKKHGFKASPLSKEKKTDNAWLGGLAGAVVARVLLTSFGPVGIATGFVIGAVIGNNYEPE